MLTLSDGVLGAFAAQARARLRQAILAHWYADLRQAGDQVGEAGRDQIIAEVEAAAAREPSLDLADLLMIADLILVERAAPPPARPH